jgi:cytidyltransferase-like protein
MVAPCPTRRKGRGTFADMPDERIATRVYVDMVGDLFHAGHVALLREAASHGDQLVVGVLSDETAAAYKRRPIMTLAARTGGLSTTEIIQRVLDAAER